MRNSVLAAALAAAGIGSTCVHAASGSAWIVEARYPDPATLQRVSARYEHLIVDRKRGVLRVETDQTGIRALEDDGLAVTVDLAASARLNGFQARLQQAQLDGVGIDSIPGFTCFRTVEETYATMDQMIANHPGIVAIDEIGPTWKKVQNTAQGYTMRALRITNLATAASEPDRPSMVVFGSIHAREKAPAELTTRFAEWLVNGYGTDPEATWLVDHNDFRLVLEANPDGRKLAEQQLYQRKNVDTINGPCGGTPSISSQYGVDLNRNFPFHWNITNGEGSSGSFCSQTYRGPVKGSEPETQNFINYVAGACDAAGNCSGGVFEDRRNGPMNPSTVAGDGGDAAPDDTSGFFIDIHRNAALVLWPWGDTDNGVGAPNEAALRTLGRRLAWFNGYTPEQSNELYKTDGTTDDSMYGLLGVPGFTIETDGADFFQDCASFESTTVPHNIAALRYAARTLHATYQLPAGPDALDISAGSDLVVAGDALPLAARIDDTRFNQSTAGNGDLATIRTIGGASAYVDTLPWEPGAIAHPLAAADGAFDASAESVVGTLDTSGLVPGRHLVHVQGVDVAGNHGPPNAAMIELVDGATVGTLSGEVDDRSTYAPLAATITLSNGSNSHGARSDAGSGAYRAHAYPGSWDVHVSAPHHLSEDLAAVVLAAGASVTHDFALYPNCTILSDDVEDGNQDWTAQSPWVIQGNVGGNATHAWNTPSYGDNLDRSLTSATHDLDGYADVSLDFDDRCATESGWDYGHVEFSTNGGSSWTSLYACSGQTSWQSHHIELPPTAGGASAFRLRFRLTSDTNTNDAGWAVDNIRLEAGGDACRAQQPPDDRIFANDFD
jgi:hypothetical protein